MAVMSETRNLILYFLAHHGGTAEKISGWLGQPVVRVEAELKRMEGDGLVKHRGPMLGPWHWYDPKQ